jgi:hypothetical protein
MEIQADSRYGSLMHVTLKAKNGRKLNIDAHSGPRAAAGLSELADGSLIEKSGIIC